MKLVLEVEKRIRSLKSALNAWVYGLTKASLTRTGNLYYAEQATKENARMWMTNVIKWKASKNTPCDAVMDYINSLDKMLLMTKSDFNIVCQGKSIIIEVRGPCTYGDSCGWLLGEGQKLLCPRGVIFTVAISEGSKEEYAVKVLEADIGKKCIIELSPAY